MISTSNATGCPSLSLVIFLGCKQILFLNFEKGIHKLNYVEDWMDGQTDKTFNKVSTSH